jgi:predicted metal-dependent hydrolase
MAEKLKHKFIKRLETDKEFRYTVERYLDLSEVLRMMEERMLALEERMSKIEEKMLKLEENQRRSLKDFEKRLEKLWKYVDSGFKGLGRCWA